MSFSFEILKNKHDQSNIVSKKLSMVLIVSNSPKKNTLRYVKKQFFKQTSGNFCWLNAIIIDREPIRYAY